MSLSPVDCILNLFKFRFSEIFQWKYCPRFNTRKLHWHFKEQCGNSDIILFLGNVSSTNVRRVSRIRRKTIIANVASLIIKRFAFLFHIVCALIWGGICLFVLLSLNS